MRACGDEVQASSPHVAGLRYLNLDGNELPYLHWPEEFVDAMTPDPEAFA